ncbi:MAG: D-alanyl-D-alanine carboxypeptidase family protein [Actinomycetota bacterium]|nr:D-alanyl-D-alanine carboxypeptidase family protein [Actinomycetota bacterium]
MTLLHGVMAVVLGLSLTGFFVDIADAAATKTRAQIAADAAALAAVAESGPYGAGAHEREAARFAAANGARLVECRCEPGATAVQVRVTLDGVVAEARAIFDPEALMPVDLAYAGEGLHPVLQRAVDELIRAARGAVHVVSGRRSTERQSVLWAHALARYGDPEVADDWVARPGTSMHERGLAVDLGGNVELAAEIAAQLGLPLHRPLPNEPWHFELRR